MRRPARLLAGFGAVLATIALTAATSNAAPASSPTTRGLTAVRLAGHTYLVSGTIGRFGIKPQRPTAAAIGATGRKVTLVHLHSSATPGPISPTPTVYLVFWGSQWSRDPAGAAPGLTAM